MNTLNLLNRPAMMACCASYAHLNKINTQFHVSVWEWTQTGDVFVEQFTEMLSIHDLFYLCRSCNAVLWIKLITKVSDSTTTCLVNANASRLTTFHLTWKRVESTEDAFVLACRFLLLIIEVKQVYDRVKILLDINVAQQTTKPCDKSGVIASFIIT